MCWRLRRDLGRDREEHSESDSSEDVVSEEDIAEELRKVWGFLPFTGLGESEIEG